MRTGSVQVDNPGDPSNPRDMNIAQIEEAVQRGVPFRIKVADGDEFPVPHMDYISLPPRAAPKRTFVVIYNDKGFASVLPLLTITSLTYQLETGT